MPRIKKENNEIETEIVGFDKETLKDLKLRAFEEGYTDIESYLISLHQQNKYINQTSSKNEISTETYEKTNISTSFETLDGKILCGDSCHLLNSILPAQSVDLIMTSPPYGLIKKKEYGNEEADQYVEWFEKFAKGFFRVLKPDGSLVLDIGGTWNKGQPTRSLYHFELLMMLCKKYGFHLAQEFYWWNPSKLPSPAEWVNIRRIRVKDAVNCIWWLSKTPYPKANNRRVLQPYSKSMEKLLRDGYKPKLRPSGHDISHKFQQDNKGAIPPNLLAVANTESNGAYQRYCREHNLKEHPARFPADIPEFFIRMLTNPGDLVLDPFAGSCVTGEVCEKLKRKWICCEIKKEYIEGAKARFEYLKDLPANDKTTINNTKKTGTKRKNPYLIYPPNALQINDEDIDLAEDCGKKRP